MSQNPVRLRYDLTASKGVRAALSRARSPVTYDSERGLDRLRSAIALPGAAGGGASSGGSGGMHGPVAANASISSAAGGGIISAIGVGAGFGAIVVALGWGVPALRSETVAASWTPVVVAAPALRRVEAPIGAEIDRGPGSAVRAPLAPPASTTREDRARGGHHVAAPLGAGGGAAHPSAEAEPEPKNGESGPRAAGAQVGSRDAVPESDELSAEMQALRELKAESDPGRALALAEAQRRRFPSGRFGEEREAVAILSLARIGRHDEARARALVFLEAHPRSAFSRSVRAETGL